MSNIEESLRELVREEMKGQKPPPAPDKRQLLWLCLCVTNTALLLWLLPETIFKTERAENLSKVVVWLGSSIFISSFVWFRENLLGLTQNRLFKIVLVVAFPILTLIYISQLNIFAVYPVIAPDDAEVIVQGQSVSDEDREDLPLSLKTHWITVQPGNWRSRNQNDSIQYPIPRKFKLTRLDVLRAWWGTKQPHWRLIYDVYVQPQGAVDEVVVRPLDIDPDFMLRPVPPYSPSDVAKPIGAPALRGQELVYQWHGASDAQLPLRLPHGKYTIFSRKKNCDGPPETVEVPLVKNRTTPLQEPCPASQ